MFCSVSTYEMTFNIVCMQNVYIYHATCIFFLVLVWGALRALPTMSTANFTISLALKGFMTSWPTKNGQVCLLVSVGQGFSLQNCELKVQL